MRGYYSFPECALHGPIAPRTVLFIWSWEVFHGRPAAECEALVAQYPGEVDCVLRDWAEIGAVCDTLRSMRARKATQAALNEIEGEKR